MRASEFEQMLDETLRELEDELEAESEPDWSTRNLIEFQGLPDNVFGVFFARVSGFDLHSDTSPDPDVIGLHNGAADRIAREIVARVNDIRSRIQPSPQCVFVTLTGFVDPDSESATRDFALGTLRARAMLARVQARLDSLARISPGVICVKLGKAGSDSLLLDDKRLFPSTTGKGRHLNRRVVVKVSMGNCPTIRGCSR